MKKAIAATAVNGSLRPLAQSSLMDSFGPKTNKRQKTTTAVSDNNNNTEMTTTTTSRGGGGFHVFCDLDGVLVDFDMGVAHLFERVASGSKQHPSFVEKKALPPPPPPPPPPAGIMWAKIAKSPNFWQNLPWTVDGKALFDTLWKQSVLSKKKKNNSSISNNNSNNNDDKNINKQDGTGGGSLGGGIRQLDILTGVANGKSVAEQKFTWCQRQLCVQVQHCHMAASKKQHQAVNPSQHHKRATNCVNVITCWTKNKHMESGPQCVLIDDRADLREAWEAKGGVFVWHTSTRDTLQQLRKIGVLQPPEEKMIKTEEEKAY